MNMLYNIIVCHWPPSYLSCRIANLVDYIKEPLKAGLQDRSPYVRRMAVMGCVKLFYIAPELVSSELTVSFTDFNVWQMVLHNLYICAASGLNLVDILYRMLRDKDPQVSCASLY